MYRIVSSLSHRRVLSEIASPAAKLAFKVITIEMIQYQVHLHNSNLK